MMVCEYGMRGEREKKNILADHVSVLYTPVDITIRVHQGKRVVSLDYGTKVTWFRCEKFNLGNIPK